MYTNLKSMMGGVVRWNIPEYFSMYSGEVLEIKPINEEEENGSITFKVKFDGFYTVIDTINGEPAENVENLELTVNKKDGAVEDKPEITRVSLDKSSLENAGGQVCFSIYGKTLKNNVTVEVLKDGSVTQDVKVVQMENQETWNEYWITLPKNEAETEVQYTLRAKLVGDPATVKEETVTVKGTGLVANPEITQVSVNKTSLESAGGVVQFSVKGKKLKDKVEVEVLKNGVAAGEVKIQQMENQETWNEYWITLPKNEETTAIEYTLRAKVTGDEASAKEAKVTVKETEKPEVNKEALKQKITDAKAIKNENYTEASWNTLQAAITAAEAVRDDADATQDVVDAQVTTLEEAINGLKVNTPQGDKKVLVVRVEDQDGNPVDDCAFVIKDSAFPNVADGMPKYPSNGVVKFSLTDSSQFGGVIRVHSWSSADYEGNELTFTSKNKEFLTVNGEEYDGIKEYTIVVTKKGEEPEKPEVNKEALEQKITDAKAIKNENYTEASWNALQAAITAAEAVREDADATQDDVDAQVTALETAINALEEKEPEKPEEVNKDELKKAIDAAKAIENKNYTEASWNALQAAIAAAEAVRNDADATQDDVDAQVTALKNAVDGLKENSEKPNPEKPNPEKPNTNKPNTNKPNIDKPNADKNENAAPKTGDSAPFVPCMAGMICAAAVAGMALKKRKSFE